VAIIVICHAVYAAAAWIHNYLNDPKRASFGERGAAILTPRQLERTIIRGLGKVQREDLPSLTEARRTYAIVRAAQGFKEIHGKFTSDETDITKLEVGEGRYTLALSLPPASSSGLANTCAFSDHCEDPCVGKGGSNRFDSAYRGKVARLALWIDHPRAALALLVHAIDSAISAHGCIGMRLNTYSDIRWENILPAWFWSTYNDSETIAFYDYTKHPIASRPSLPNNYRLTYSVSPRSTLKEIHAQRAAGNSVAVVVTTRGGRGKDGTYLALPVAADSVETLDGDKDDRRYRDPRGAVVMLRRKNGLAADHPLVVSDVRLGEILA